MRPATSTADYYHLDGLYWLRPYDLQSFGALGTAIREKEGHRYAWVFSPDHADENHGWGEDGGSIYVGFSNDPAVTPDPTTLRKIIPFRVRMPDGVEYFGFQVPWLVYNPDSTEFPFHLYLEGHASTGTNQPREEEVLFRSGDLLTWYPYGVTHAATTEDGLTAYQTITRLETGRWLSVGAADPIDGRLGTTGIWSSKDGLKFTLVRTISRSHGGFKYERQGAPDLDIRGQRYAICIEHCPSKERYVSCVPVDVVGDLGPTGGMPTIRISPPYIGSYPNRDHLHSISGYSEDGIYHLWAVHGFFSDVRLVYGASHNNGGGLDEQFLDYYSFAFDEGAAASAAPYGMSVECDAGAVELRWHDLTNRRYRIYRGEAEKQQSELIAEIDGTSVVDQPAPDRCWWYRVIPLKGDIEQKSRMLSVYASRHSSLTNRHIHRAITAGATQQSINARSIDDAVTWLRKNDLLKHLLFWTNSRFGYKLKDGAIEKIFDLGTTRLPRGGDCTNFNTHVKSKRALSNSSAPLEDDMFVYGGGRSNTIRRKQQLTFVVSYGQINAPRTLLRYGHSPSISIEHENGHASLRICYENPNLAKRLPRLWRLFGRVLRNPLPYIRVTLLVLNNKLAQNAQLTRFRDKARRSAPPRHYQVLVSAPVGTEKNNLNVVAGTIDSKVLTAYANDHVSQEEYDLMIASDIDSRRRDEVLHTRVQFSAMAGQLDEYQLQGSSVMIFDTALSYVQLKSLANLVQ